MNQFDTSKLEGFFQQIKKASNSWTSHFNPTSIFYYEDIVGNVRAAFLKQALLTGEPVQEHNGKCYLKFEDIPPDSVVLYKSPNTALAMSGLGVMVVSFELSEFMVTGTADYVSLIKRLNESLAP